MKLYKLIKDDFNSLGGKEKILLPLAVFFIVVISLITNDDKIALISAVCGIIYTVFAGKGRILCYYIGIIGTLCYSYIAFRNGFWGNFILNMLFYLPLEIVGIFKWKRYINKNTGSIIKTELNLKQRIAFLIFIIVFWGILYLFLLKIEGNNPLLDSIITVLSVSGMYLTVRRCIEQWFVWFFVNLSAFIMWCFAYLEGSNCIATVFMWLIYLILSIYFYFNWQKDIVRSKIYNE